MEHTQLRPTSSVAPAAANAAKAVAEAGGSPRQQIDAARAASGQRLGYLPHHGSRQKARALQRMLAAQAKAVPVETHPYQLIHSDCGQVAFFLATVPEAKQPMASATCRYPNGKVPESCAEVLCGSCGDPVGMIDIVTANITPRVQA